MYEVLDVSVLQTMIKEDINSQILFQIIMQLLIIIIIYIYISSIFIQIF